MLFGCGGESVSSETSEAAGRGGGGCRVTPVRRSVEVKWLKSSFESGVPERGGEAERRRGGEAEADTDTDTDTDSRLSR